MFHLWFNTFFITKTELTMTKKEIDKANKDKKDSTFDADFRVTLEFVTLQEDNVEASIARMSFHEDAAVDVGTEEEEDLSDDDSIAEEDTAGSVELA